MLTLQKHEISTTIIDRYANIIYSFHFENLNENKSNELCFQLTIDPTAFISKFEADIDGELFIGQTKEKETALTEYNEAKEKNENTILISQVDANIPNVFEIKTNIDSKSCIILNIQVEQFVQKQFEFNQLNLQILRNFTNYNIIQNINYIAFKFDIQDKSGIYNVNIPLLNDNNIAIDERIMNKLEQTCIINGKIMNNSSLNELTLKYKIKGEQNESHILFDSNSNTFCHIISNIFDNSIVKDNILIPRRVIFVIDRSGSMSGLKWNKTISATIIAIKQLRKGYDRFSIILFDHDIELLPYMNMNMKGCIEVNDKSINDSINILQTYKVNGSTNINDALLKAIEIFKIGILLLNNDTNTCNFFMNQIIFITDGDANHGECDTKNIIKNVNNANDLSKICKYNNKISICAFGIGNDCNNGQWITDLNHSFLKILAVNNNGFYKRIKQTSADSSLNEYFNILSQPVSLNINLNYKNKNISDLTPIKFNSLYFGNDLVICGKITNNLINDYNIVVTISSITGQKIKENNKIICKPINISKQFQFKINTNNNTVSVERIWAYLKLQQFANKKLIYNDMIEMDDDEKKENESLPLSLALKYQFITPWTSMIVVKAKDKHPIKHNINYDQQKEQPNDNHDMIISSRRKSILDFHQTFDSGIRTRHSHRRSSLDDKTYLKSLAKSVANINLVSTALNETPAHSLINSPINNETQYEEEFCEFGHEIMGNEKVRQLEEYYVQQLQIKEIYIQDLEQQLKHFKTTNSDMESEMWNKFTGGDEQKQIEGLQKQVNDKDELIQDLQINLRQLSEKRKKELMYFVQELQKMKIKCHDWSIKLMEKVCEIESKTVSDDTMQMKEKLFESKEVFYDKEMMDELFKMGFKTRYVVQAMDNVENRRDRKEIMEYIIRNFNDKLCGSLKRIVKELEDLKCNSMLNCLVVYDVSIWNWKVSVKGPVNSVYEHGVFDIDVHIPKDYPLKAPKCRFITKIYHCNVNENGEINLDLLHDKWNCSLTVSAVLLGVINLLSNPNVNDSVGKDMEKLYIDNRDEYDRVANEWTEKYAK